MIAVQIHGRVTTDPRTSLGSGGRSFTTIRMRSSADGENVGVAGVGFGEVAEELLTLRTGDWCTVLGSLSIQPNDPHVLKVLVTRVMPLTTEVRQSHEVPNA